MNFKWPSIKVKTQPQGDNSNLPASTAYVDEGLSGVGIGNYDNWPTAQYVLSKDRTIPANCQVIISGPFQHNGHVVTRELGGVLVIL